jgi:hypothetical protein
MIQLRSPPHSPELTRDRSPIVAKTVKGCGISFMENRMEWHYLPLTAAKFRQAVDEVLGCATHFCRSLVAHAADPIFVFLTGDLG